MWELPDPREFNSLLDLIEDAARRYAGREQMALRTDAGRERGVDQRGGSSGNPRGNDQKSLARNCDGRAPVGRRIGVEPARLVVERAAQRLGRLGDPAEVADRAGDTFRAARLGDPAVAGAGP